MMPGARYFIITRPVLYLVRWKGRESPLQSVLRRAAVLPILPAALLLLRVLLDPSGMVAPSRSVAGLPRTPKKRSSADEVR
jgi:hypothetical protein